MDRSGRSWFTGSNSGDLFLKQARATIAVILWTVVVGLIPAAAIQAAEKSAPVDATVSGVGDAPDRVNAVRIVINDRPGREDYYTGMARRIIPITPGDRLSEENLTASLDALRLSNRFAAIHVDTAGEPGATILIFTLTPYRYISQIRISGAYPLFERDILNQMTIYPGNPYTGKDLSSQIAAIKALYRREGFIDPQVTVSSQTDPDGDTVTVRVDVDRGPHFSMGRLTFSGVRGVSTASLKWRMRTWRTAQVPKVGRFSEYRLKQDMESLLAHYRRQGFADVELSYRLSEPDEAHRVDVTLEVTEGPRYRVEIEGNRHFWNLTLRKDLVLDTRGNRGNSGVRRSIRNIEKRYRAAGFLDAQVTVEKTDAAGDPVPTRQLRLLIDEGPQTIVQELDIAGNRVVPDRAIQDQVLTQPPSLFHDGALVPETLDEDVSAVISLYTEKGFLDRTVDAEVAFSGDRTGADVTLDIEEGPQAVVRAIAVTGLEGTSHEAARQQLVHRIGEPFRQAALDQEREAILGLVAAQGHPHTTVNPTVTFSDDRTQVDIVHAVDPGPLVTLGEVFIAGNLRTRDRILRRVLDVTPGMPLSLRELNDGQRRLRDLDILQNVSFRTLGLKERQETVNLFVEVEEVKPYFTQFGTGYESDRGLFGRATVGDRNLFGRNKSLWASAEVSQTGYRLETRLTEPRIFNTPTTASLGLFNEELTEFNQPFGTRTTGGSLGFTRQWERVLTTALSFSLERRDQFRVDDDPLSAVEEETRTIFVTTPFVRYDTRDSFIRPTRGYYASLGVDISKGLDNQLDDFVRYLFDTRYFVSPMEKLTLAAMFRFGQVLPYSEAGLVPDDQLFFLGGIRDVRGFGQNLLRYDGVGNPVGGKTAVVGSLEARFELGLNLELTTFFDLGSVQDAQVEAGSDRFRPAVGLGLRYITPIGPMGLLYGIPLDRDEGEPAGQFHLSIGYTF
jgi:outer membrane protein insertion porin family